MTTDALAVLISYFIVRRIVAAQGWATLVGMVIGGSLAAGAGIWMTSHWE